MNTELLDLSQRIGREVEDIGQTIQLCIEAWSGSQQFPDQQAHFLNSLALNLHSFYNGLERIFELIARRLDSTFPSDEHWHRSLLNQMGQELPEIRPAVLSTESIHKLRDFLAFRHLVRNMYTFNLETQRPHALLERVQNAWQSVRADIEVFRELLNEAGSAK